MSITLGIWISIVAPTIFFVLRYLWANLLDSRLSRGVSKQTGISYNQPERYARLLWLMVQYHFRSVYGQSVFLFAVNGLIIVYELGNSIIGTILIIAGWAIAISGIRYMSVHEDPTSFRRPPPKFFPVPFILVISLAIGEVGLIGSYEYTTLVVSALLSVVMGIIGAAVVYHLYKTHTRIVYVPSSSPDLSTHY